MELRDYQVESIKNINKAWEDGYQNVLMVLPTGSGKSVVISEIIKRHTGRALLIAHRSEIICQLSLTLANLHVVHSLAVAVKTYSEIWGMHVDETGDSNFLEQTANTIVASIDTIQRFPKEWFDNFTLYIVDEGHHVLKENKWGKVAAHMPDAKGLLFTATPMRADRKGLGRHAHGVVDKMIIGPSTKKLMERGHLVQCKIHAAQSNLDLSRVPISSGGDYNPEKLREAVLASSITGDIIENYLKFAAGKKGVVFAVSIEQCHIICDLFNQAGISAAVISGTTPTVQRALMMRYFREGRIMMLINVDIMGEGTDVPDMEVVIQQRPTKSLALQRQQIGRCLRPSPGKLFGIVIDHVNNCVRHGYPDAPVIWSLDSEINSKRNEVQVKIKTCCNVDCMCAYESFHKSCPFCHYISPPASRSSPEAVDGDLIEMNRETLQRLRAEIARIDNAPRFPAALSRPARASLMKKHARRQEVQSVLRDEIVRWSDRCGTTDKSEIYRRFYYEFDIDIMTAQTLNTRDATELLSRMKENDIDFTTKMN